MKTNTVPSNFFGRGKVPLSELSDIMHNFIDEACHNSEINIKLQKNVKFYREERRRLVYENEQLKSQKEELQNTVEEKNRIIEAKDKEIAELKKALSRANSRINALQDASSQQSKSLTVVQTESQLPRVLYDQSSPFPDFAIIDTLRNDTMFSELTTGKALVYWAKLVQAGFVTPDLRLASGTSRHVAAKIAYQFDKKFQLRKKWKPFEKLWSIQNLRQDFEREVKRDESKLEKVNEIFGLNPEQKHAATH